MSDVLLQSGNLGLSFDSTFLSPLLFFLVICCSFFHVLQFSANCLILDLFFPQENFFKTSFFVRDRLLLLFLLLFLLLYSSCLSG